MNTTQLEQIINKIENNKGTAYVFLPDYDKPSGGIALLIRIGLHLQNIIKTKFVYQPKIDNQYYLKKPLKNTTYYKPLNLSWIYIDETTNIDTTDPSLFTVLLPNKNQTPMWNNDTIITETLTTINPEDIIIVPESFVNILKEYQQYEFTKIVIAQSYTYILPSLIHNNYHHYNIDAIISVSNYITQFLKYGIQEQTPIYNLKQGINRNIFYPEPLHEKTPIIGVLRGRGPETQLKIINIIRLFYRIAPHMSYVTFVPLENYSQKEYAMMIRKYMALFIYDDIAGFGTAPLEAMATHTRPIAINTPAYNEYATPQNGKWINPENIMYITEQLTNEIENIISAQYVDTNIEQQYEETLKNYTIENEKKQITEIFQQIKQNKINKIKNIWKQNLTHTS